MISDYYRQKLISEAKKLDGLLGQEYGIEKLVHEIVNEENDKSILELVKIVGIINNKQIISNFEKKQEQFIEMLYKYIGAIKVEGIYNTLKQSSTYSLEELLLQLDEIVGLDDVKDQVKSLIAFNKIQQLRVENGLKRSDKTLHMAFLGNPGTAKTTVARIVGRMYKSIGLLSKGHFIEANRTDLIAEYQGQTAIKVKRLINRAKGGVLFIDEAYSLTENENGDSYGRESLTELTKALEDYRDDLVVIVAGYPNLMGKFFDSNPGLKSRFNTFIKFNDYSLEELLGIFKFLCKKNEYSIEEEVFESVRILLEDKLEQRDEHFSNGRFVRNIFDDIILNQSKRLSKLEGSIDKEALMLITIEDILSL